MNVCVYRIPRGESICHPPSHCVYCNKKIQPYDMIPVLSFIFLHGKCRYCAEKISFTYPAVETINAVLYVLLYHVYGLNTNFLKYSVFVSLIITIGLIDYKTADVYTNTILFGAASGVFFLVCDGLFRHMNITTYIYGAILGAAIIALIIILTHGMGKGDAEICFLCGLFCGTEHMFLIFFLSVIIGAATGVILIILKGKGKTDYMPFGPSIAAASIISVLAGKKIIMWYMLKLYLR